MTRWAPPLVCKDCLQLLQACCDLDTGHCCECNGEEHTADAPGQVIIAPDPRFL